MSIEARPSDGSRLVGSVWGTDCGDRGGANGSTIARAGSELSQFLTAPRTELGRWLIPTPLQLLTVALTS